MITIEDFYRNNKVKESFDEKEYVLKNPEVANFYQPYCKDNNYSEKQRLYYHYILHYAKYGNDYIIQLSILTDLMLELMEENKKRYKSPLNNDIELSRIISDYVHLIFSSPINPNIIESYPQRMEAIKRCRKALPFVSMLRIRQKWEEGQK
jgi:hypothetical protein